MSQRTLLPDDELGRVAAPIPFSSTVYLAAEALLLSGDEADQSEYLPKVATGEIRFVLGTVTWG
jgi:alkylation response protein AidB-like acyl-CoA dehydrogenase